MSEAKLHVFAVVQVLNVGLIDHGNTLVLQLKRSDGGEEAILMPLAVGKDLMAKLVEQLTGQHADAATHVAG